MATTSFNALSIVGSLLLHAVVITSSTAQETYFRERWEQSPIGSVDLYGSSLFVGDAGTWNAGDTVSSFPECGDTPQTVEITQGANGRTLRLISRDSKSECADNVWVGIQRVEPLELNPFFPIFINTNTVLSFAESGALVDPSPIREPTCIGPPCGDNISLVITDDRGFQFYELVYVLQRATESQTPHVIPGLYAEVLLGPNDGIYRRNLAEDFRRIPGYDPTGARISSISFEVAEHGTAVLDDLRIGEADGICSFDAEHWIYKAYIGYYNRCPDVAGLRYWCQRLDKEGGGSDLSAIIAAFGTSDEYTQQFGTLIDTDLINGLYLNMFDRDAESGGVAFYAGLLDSHRQHWSDTHGGSSDGGTEYALSLIALDVLNGAQGSDARMLAQKLMACYFGDAVVEPEPIDPGPIPPGCDLIGAMPGYTFMLEIRNTTGVAIEVRFVDPALAIVPYMLDGECVKFGLDRVVQLEITRCDIDTEDDCFGPTKTVSAPAAPTPGSVQALLVSNDLF